MLHFQGRTKPLCLHVCDNRSNSTGHRLSCCCALVLCVSVLFGPTSPHMSLRPAVERTDSSSRSRQDSQADRQSEKGFGGKNMWSDRCCGSKTKKREPKLNEGVMEGGSNRRREHVAWLPWAQCDLSESHCGEQHKLRSLSARLRQASPAHLEVTHRPPNPQ